MRLGRRLVRDTGPGRATRELVLERDEFSCAACGDYVVFDRFSIHHRRNRGSGGSSLPEINAPSNLLTVCGSGTTGCHGRIGDRPMLACDMVWSVPLNSVQAPAQVPVHHAVFGLVLLDDDGGWEYAS